MMSLGSLNYLPIFAAAIASFVFGGIWYNVFSKQWMDAVGMSPERMQKDRSSLGLYVLAFVAQLVMAWMLPPVTLPELVTLATWSWRCAALTCWMPTPLTVTRRKVCCTPVVPGFVAVPLSTKIWGFVPKLVVARSDWT